LLNVTSTTYLVPILGKQQVAQIKGSPIYVITSIGLIPLSSQSEAKSTIEKANSEIQVRPNEQIYNDVVDNDISPEEEAYHSDGSITDDASKASKSLNPPYKIARQKSQEKDMSVAQDVISKKGQYGRFAERWFSRQGWTSERRRAQGMSAEDARGTEGTEAWDRNVPYQENNYKGSLRQQRTQGETPTVPAQKHGTSTLLPKLLQTTKILFASQSFFFSYDYDITRRLGDQESKSSGLPLHQKVDPLYFWNQHLASPFIENSNHAYVLPVMQGFVGQRSFRIDPLPLDTPGYKIAEANEDLKDNKVQKRPDTGSSFLVTLISRRSLMRPGLRYLRRGVDEKGHAANSVETEQLLSRLSWDPSAKIHSFTQYRGSIPLFFSQSPYAFKPVPVLQHSFNTNHSAFKRHFSDLINRYGNIQIALLVDKQGGEAEIGKLYENHINHLASENGSSGIRPAFNWFDFHDVCRGMRFENVSILLDNLNGVLDDFGSTVEVAGHTQRNQQGVLRTSCMDCLDRTNVVQSACGSRALEKQLQEEGMEVSLQTDTKTQWINALWADNGDAISKQYSSTAALKGDYTRTRKRNYRGALNDFRLTLSRYYNNIVNDYFSQAAIDYLVGNVTEEVFEEFEANMMSKDPAISMRTVRATAIDTSSRIVIADQDEDLVGGWTLLTPQEPNTLRTYPLEEAILLLTDAALYAVRFDWNSDKVSSYERISLNGVTSVVYGTYITSTLTESQTNQDRNVGFVIRYRPGKEDVARVNTRSLYIATGQDFEPDGEPGSARPVAASNLFNPSDPSRLLHSSGNKPERNLRILAFKALPATSSLSALKSKDEGSTLSERQLVANICDYIKRAAYGDGGGGSDTGLSLNFIEEGQIVSLKEARKNTGYLEQWGHSLKKLVWA
ncbi:MAG: hypothetical protein Q9219_007051, partial [cf. Caloplaca sp. 3 TL-2023]